MKIRILSKTGNSICDRIRFEARSDEPISREDASKAQKGFGYHPAGYGFYNFETSQQDDGSYKAIWNCSACCD